MTTEWIKKTKSPLVFKAFEFAKKAHSGMKRASGEDYILHPLEVAHTIYNWGLDESSVAAAFLHDVVEDTKYSLKEIKKNFGEEVAFLVDGLTKLKNIYYTEQRDPENIRKFVIFFSKDIRVLIIKIADRLHNMKTINSLDDEKRKKIALETLEIYAPLAYRLGMTSISGQLEDLCFPYVYPEEYKWLMNELKNDNFDKRQKYATELISKVEKELKANNIIPIKIDARAKHYYSLYKKLLRYDLDLSKIYDLVAVRIIVRTIEECYASLGVVHKIWQPLLGRIKDYIARPKPNGYKSLHTTVFTPENNSYLEIQIRTEEMHKEDELGIAAHWAYAQIKDNKETYKNWRGIKNKKEMLWVEQLRNWVKYFNSNSDNQNKLIENIKNEFLKDRIFVFTPENDVIDLPAGSTPVDFAYKIHSFIGNNCIGAKINGKIAPLDTKLNSGDTVEIITQKGKNPSNKWLDFVKTITAKKAIKKALKKTNQNLLQKTLPQFLEIKIINLDRPGYLKDITEIFSHNKINIVFLKSETDKNSAFSTVHLKIKNIPLKKLESILIKIKKVPDTKEVSFKFIN